jgi:hypothetical protein
MTLLRCLDEVLIRVLPVATVTDEGIDEDEGRSS